MGCFPSHEPTTPDGVSKQKNKRTCFLCQREAQKDNLLCALTLLIFWVERNKLAQRIIDKLIWLPAFKNFVDYERVDCA